MQTEGAIAVLLLPVALVAALAAVSVVMTLVRHVLARRRCTHSTYGGYENTNSTPKVPGHHSSNSMPTEVSCFASHVHLQSNCSDSKLPLAGGSRHHNSVNSSPHRHVQKGCSAAGRGGMVAFKRCVSTQTHAAAAAATPNFGGNSLSTSTPIFEGPVLSPGEWAQQLQLSASTGDLCELEQLLAAQVAPASRGQTSTNSTCHDAGLCSLLTTDSLLETPLHSSSGEVSHTASSSSTRARAVSAALAEALWGQHDHLVPLLIAAGTTAGTRPNAALDSNGNTVLHIAARQGCSDATIKALLAAGAVPSAVNKHQQTALHAAAAFGHTGAARILLHWGAAVDTASADGLTPLIEAIQGGHADMVNLLVTHGANVLHADGNLKTPLYWAAVSGLQSITQSLCDRLMLESAPAAPTAVAAVHEGASVVHSNSGSRSADSLEKVLAAFRSCALSSFSHNQLGTFAVLMKELAKQDPSAVENLLKALGAQNCSKAALALAVTWAGDVTPQDGQRQALRAEASSLAADRLAAQQLLVAIAHAAKQLEERPSLTDQEGQ